MEPSPATAAESGGQPAVGIEEPAPPDRARALRPEGRRRRRIHVSRTLSVYLLRGLAVNCLVSFLVLEAVEGIILTVRATEGFSFDFLIIFPVLMRAFGQAMPLTLPIALLFGTGLFVGRLNADRESTALRSFGVSVAHLVLPALAFGLVLAIPMLLFNMEVVPRLRFANRNVGSLILEQLGYLGEGWNLEYRSGGRSLWIHHYNGPTLDGIFLSISKEGEGAPLSRETMERVQAPSYPIYLFAERALVYRGTGKLADRAVVKLQGVNLFFDNDFLTPSKPADFMNLVRFDEIPWTPQFTRKTPGIKDLNLSDLRAETRRRWAEYAAAGEAGAPRDTQKHLFLEHAYAVTEIHRRIALSLTVLTFPVTAFLLGLALKSSNRLLPFFLSGCIVPGLYFFCELLGNRLAERGVLPWATEQAGNLAVVLFATILVSRLYRGPR